jgi:hypothetical protein
MTTTKTPARPVISVTKKPNPYLYTMATLSTMQELIMDVLQAAKAATIVEIGSEHGAFTEILCARARESGGRLISIDPLPQAGALEFIRAHDQQPYYQFMRKTSHEALPGLQADAYIVDGDHNYYTVRRELELIGANCGGAPWVAILHDVGWPWGRRDFYYNPGVIPARQRHAHSHDIRIAPGNPGVAASGLPSCDGTIQAFALKEGGAANGVRTAVEDFLAGKPEYEFVVIPTVFGLGIVYNRNAPWSESLSKLLAPYASNPLLERLEANRLELLLRVIELDRQLSARPTVHAPPNQQINLPKSPLGLRLLATALFVEKQWADAGLLFQTLVHHFPNDLEIWQARLECARQQKHQTHARLILNDAVRIHPEWADALTGNLAAV